jgi:hypothetical protein
MLLFRNAAASNYIFNNPNWLSSHKLIAKDADPASIHSAQAPPLQDGTLENVINILNQTNEFRKLVEETKTLGLEIQIHPLNDQESDENNVKTAKMVFSPNWIFDGGSVEIFYRNSMSLEEKIQGVMMEHCNAKYALNFNELDTKACSGKISKSKYVREKERIEWIALNESLKISQAIDKLGIFNKKIYDDFANKLAVNFDDYLTECQENGHAAGYEVDYDTLT